MPLGWITNALPDLPEGSIERQNDHHVEQYPLDAGAA
jgi:hypothetical protein